MMKEILRSNTKTNSMAKAILVRWKWNEEDNYRTFIGLRYGGTTENQYDLNVRYPEKSEEKISLLLHADQLAKLTREEKVDKINRLLHDHSWKWDPAKESEIIQKVEKFIR